MERAVTMLLCCIVWLLAVACTDKTPSKTTTPSSTAEDTISETQIMQIFSNDAEYQNRTVTDCVVADDAAFGLTGVVLYTDHTENLCCLAFVHDTWSYPLGLDAKNTMTVAEDSILTYLGNGTVTLSLADPKDGSVYDYTVAYTVDGSHTQFTASSEKRP